MKQLIVILMCCCIAVSACTDDKHHSEEPTTVFSLSRRHVDLYPGDTAEVYVSGTLEFALECSDESVVTARREGRKAIITAISRGEAEVLFLTQFNDIACTVTVEESLLDRLDAVLANDTPRVVGMYISLTYGTPGIMIAASGGKVNFINIGTRESVELSLSGNVIDGIKVNGVAQDILNCTLYKETDDRCWYLVLVEGDLEGLWVVIEK